MVLGKKFTVPCGKSERDKQGRLLSWFRLIYFRQFFEEVADGIHFAFGTRELLAYGDRGSCGQRSFDFAVLSRT